MAQSKTTARSTVGAKSPKNQSKTSAKTKQSADTETKDLTQKAKGPSPTQIQVKQLTELSNEAGIFQTLEGEIYADCPVNGHREILPVTVTGNGFATWLKAMYYKLYGIAPSRDNVAMWRRAGRRNPGTPTGKSAPVRLIRERQS